MDKTIFRKTERGLAEVRARTGAIDARMRTVLILVNGSASVADLAGQLPFDPRTQIAALSQQGFIDAVAADTGRATPPAAPPAVPPTAPAAQAVPPAAAPQPPAADELRAAKLRALTLLRSLFGPGGDEVAQPLLQARTPAQFDAALVEIEEKLSVYQGRKGAARLIAQIVNGS